MLIVNIVNIYFSNGNYYIFVNEINVFVVMSTVNKRSVKSMDDTDPKGSLPSSSSSSSSVTRQTIHDDTYSDNVENDELLASNSSKMTTNKKSSQQPVIQQIISNIHEDDKILG